MSKPQQKTKKERFQEPDLILRINSIKVPVYENTALKDEETYGTYHNNPPRIEHNGIEDKHIKALTLFHESFHCISDIHCLGLSEEQVQKLEILIPLLIRDNWWVFKPLFEEED